MTSFNPQNPIIVQGDGSVLLEVDNAKFTEARDLLARFAELVKSPEYIHTYRINPLSLWNAAASGMSAAEIVDGLAGLSKYPLPSNVQRDTEEYMGRYGRLKLIWHEQKELRLVSEDALLITEVSRHKQLKPYIATQIDAHTLRMDAARRGHIKQALVMIGYPAEDLAGYIEGEALEIKLRPRMLHNDQPFVMRDYQRISAEAFHAGGTERGGSGVIVLPCGAGKTIVGIAAMDQLQTNTLILTPNTVSVRQWRDELLDKTTLRDEDIGEYTGQKKQIRPITISTYQTITYRKRGTKNKNLPIHEVHPHFGVFDERDWGLIIYDEVHLLPAPVFSITAELQARRRLGLTATLVREDGLETDVFSLIGPKKYDVPWRELEKQGWIATAIVNEVRIPLPQEIRLKYAVAERRQQHRIAMENPEKLSILAYLLAKHAGDRVLVVGMYIKQLEEVQARYGYPLITGKTPVKERRKLFQAFRDGEFSTLIVSKVGNFAIDLPDANVMIQLSGTFGSRQEEAQRLGRILRPKSDDTLAHFYTLVSKDTSDQEFAANRQRFLTEQGYRYNILYDDEIPDFEPIQNVMEL
ncbi:MAG TPA: DEAD/DEAH box helicase [Anaerolineae bacterium]|nr:DEAD/DEAH box helicase [Anaerolineae bacterium]